MGVSESLERMASTAKSVKGGFKQLFRSTSGSGNKAASQQDSQQHSRDQSPAKRHSSSFDFTPQVYGDADVTGAEKGKPSGQFDVTKAATKNSVSFSDECKPSYSRSDGAMSESVAGSGASATMAGTSCSLGTWDEIRASLESSNSCVDLPMPPSSAGRASGGGGPAVGQQDLQQAGSQRREPTGDSCRSSGEDMSTGSPSAAAKRVATARSSFALERQSLEANRACLKKLGGSWRFSLSDDDLKLPGNEDALVTAFGVPPALRTPYLRLATLPRNTPLPLCTLAVLWGCPGDLASAQGIALLLQERQIMHLAALNTGEMWCLVSPPHLKALHHACRSSMAGMQSAFLEGYRAAAGVASYADLPDDGYIVNNLGYHLAEARQMEALRALLVNPDWLERRLHGYGVGCVVSDYRRYFMVRHDNEVKLLLEALQMSTGAFVLWPHPGMLGMQMACRLMTIAPQSKFVTDWCTEQRTRCNALSANGPCVGEPRPLWTAGPTLDQGAGLQRMKLTGHTEGVTQLMMAPSGLAVVSASKDGTVRVWDLEIGDCELLLEGHAGPVSSFSISAAGDFLISGSTDGTACLWELERGKCMRRLEGHLGAITGVALDPHSRFAVTASMDGTARVWELAGGRCVHVLEGHGRTKDSCVILAVALGSDSRTCVTAGDDFTARVWDLAKGTCVRVLEGHRGWVVDVAITPDSTKALTASHDGTAILWDLWSGAKEHVFSDHSGRVNKVRFSADGQRAMTVSDDASAIVYDVRSGALRQRLQGGHTAWVTDAALSGAGALATTASADRTAVVWDVGSAQRVRTLEGHNAEVTSVVLTKRGRFAVTGCEDGSVHVWDLHAPRSSPVESHRGQVHAVRVTSDGSKAVTIGEDGELRVWCAATGRSLGRLPPAFPSAPPARWLHLTSDGRHAVTAAGNRGTRIVDLDTTTVHSEHPGRQGSRLKAFGASGDGQVGVTALWDSTVSVVCIPTGDTMHVLQERGTPASEGHAGGVNNAYISPDGATVLTVSKDATARVWSTDTGRCCAVLEGHTDAIEAAAMSPDWRLALTVSYDGTARVWDLAGANLAAQGEGCASGAAGGSCAAPSGVASDGGGGGDAMSISNGDAPETPTGAAAAAGGRGGVRCVYVLTHPPGVAPSGAALSPDGLRALTLAAGSAYLWDLSSGQLVDVLQAGGASPLTGAAFSADSEFCATCSADGLVGVWSTHHGLHEGVFAGDSGATCCAFVPPSKTLHPAAGGGEEAPAAAVGQFGSSSSGMPLPGLVVGTNAGRLHVLV